MKADWQILAELAVFLDLNPDGEDIAAAAFNRLGFPNYAEHYDPDLVRQLVLELERRHEAAAVVREYGEEGLGLLYPIFPRWARVPFETLLLHRSSINRDT